MLPRSGASSSFWRAVDQDGDVIDILVQPRRDLRAAERFFRKLFNDYLQELIERKPLALVGR